MNKAYLGLVVLVLAALLISGCAQQVSGQTGNGSAGGAGGGTGNGIGGQPGTGNLGAGTSPAVGRTFYMGIVPTPKSIPNTTFEDIVSAYEEAADISEISMVWVEPSGIGEYETLKQKRVIEAVRVYGMMPLVTLNFATVKEVPGRGLQYVVDAPAGIEANLSDPEFRALWVEEAKNIARDFKPEYLSLGNEINDYFYLHPEELDAYVSMYDEAYAAVKEVSPGTKVFVVFSLNHMKENEQYEMIERFNGRSDLIGFTTYPWQEYANPEDIPADYYSGLSAYAQKPIAFTEIGWPSSTASGTGNGEAEQARFLSRFVELTKGMDVEMVNWLFLHEVEVGGIAGAVSTPGTSTIALKNADGSRKEVYAEWVALYNITINRAGRGIGLHPINLPFERPDSPEK